MKTQWALIVALLFSLIIAVFAIVNNDMVEVNFLFTTVELSLVLLILGSAAAGAMIMVFLSLVRHVKVGFEVRDLKKKIKLLEDDIKEKDQLLAETAPGVDTEGSPQAVETVEEEPVEEEKVDCRQEVDVQKN